MIPEKVQVKVKEISRVNLSFQTRPSLVNEIRKRDESQRREAGRRSSHNAHCPPHPTPHAQGVSGAGELQKGRGNFKEPCL